MRVLRVFETLTTQLSLRIGLKVEIAPQDGVWPKRVDEIKIALRELDRTDDLPIEK